MGIVQKESIKLTVVFYLGSALGYLNKVILFANFFTTTQVGLTGVLINVALLYAQIATMGIPAISNRFFPFFNNKEKRHHGFFFWGNIFVFIGFTLSTLVFILFKPIIIGKYIDNSPLIVNYYYYLIPLALALVYFQFFESYLRSLLKTVVPTFLNEVFSKLLQTACIGLYALKWVNFHQFVIIFVLCNFLITCILLIYIIYLKEFFLVPEKSRIYKRLFNSIITYGFFTIPLIIGAGILVNIDSLMIASKLNLGYAGIYTTIFLITTAISLPYYSIQKITFPLVGRFWKNRDMASVADLYRKTTLVMMIVGGGCVLLMFGNIDYIFGFIPKEYLIARYSFLLLCTGRYAEMICGLNGIILLTSKKYKYDLMLMLLLVSMTIILNLILLPVYGITGAAIATLFSLVFYSFLRVGLVWYFFKLQPFTLNCLWILLITIATFGIVYFIPLIYNKYISICINSIVIGVVYMGLIIFFRFSPEVNSIAFKITKWKYLKPDKSMF
ncbi:MAG TPA: oligosaccharide flippase family protein [Bacteroidia bacterium]|jgi:O-antigen/teichoic acid export membrane protein|nr:oligosaccharide flippase family protein [Bacteroidia bacterium]